MLKEIVGKWDTNKGKLEEWFKKTAQSEYNSYEKIVKALFDLVINDSESDYNNWDTSKIHVIDDGDYQGTQLFLIPKKTYQPSPEDYLITHTYYGSCSGCDTLQGINSYEDGVPNDSQLKDYMELALHLIQKMSKLSDATETA